jgi:hypothetical protein
MAASARTVEASRTRVEGVRPSRRIVSVKPAGRRPSVASTRRGAVKVPLPCRTTSRPSCARSAIARLAVARLTPASRMISCSEGRAASGSQSRAAARSRSRSWW